MRQSRLTDARNFFGRAIAADSTSYDAVAGAGMAAYRAGDPASARRSFERALRIVPGDSTALSYLATIPVPIVDAGPTTRPRPTATTIVSRTGKRIFEVRDASGRWSPLWIKAVNLGAALPGKYPSEFPPNDSTYEQWIALIAEMGANAIRVYTIHPPHFYAALRSWNLAHPAHPIWLIHGVWAELPPGKKEEKYDDPQWLGQFRGEMRHVVALLHGDAAIPASPGHASGVYRADVSQWTLGYIIGREWEPYSVVAYNALHPNRTSFGGTYITLRSGNPLEAWLAEQCDYLVNFEMQQYNAQRPDRLHELADARSADASDGDHQGSRSRDAQGARREDRRNAKGIRQRLRVSRCGENAPDGRVSRWSLRVLSRVPVLSGLSCSSIPDI